MAKAMNENPDRTRNDFKNILLMTFEFSCPVSLTSAILSEFPHLTALKDEQGRVPLATALHVPDNTIPLRALQLLIMVNPYILLERDHDGRNPFHVAIDKDQDWDDMMQLMLLYEPECIRYRDDVTGLYDPTHGSALIHASCAPGDSKPIGLDSNTSNQCVIISIYAYGDQRTYKTFHFV
jgi:hypothetical protein